MKKVILYIAVSQDYFIATRDGGIDWLHDPAYAIPGEDFGYADFYSKIGVTLMGKKTFEQVVGFDMPFPYADKENIVFTSNPGPESHPNVRFETDPVSTVAALKKEGDADIWLVGGGAINSELMKAGLVDSIILTVLPIELKEGIPICEPLDFLSQFEMAASTSYENGFIQMDLIRVIS